MFDLLVILVLLALAFPVIAIVALVMVLSLRNDFARLDGRIRALELERTPRPAVAAQRGGPLQSHRNPRLPRRCRPSQQRRRRNLSQLRQPPLRRRRCPRICRLRSRLRRRAAAAIDQF